MADDRLAWKFRRAARQRMVAVDYLLNGGLNFDAVYLAGYVVECSLKALLLSLTPESEHPEVLNRFRGRRGHDFEALLLLLRLRHCNVPRATIRQLAELSDWDTAWRYEPGTISEANALNFVNACREVMLWAERSM